MADYSEFAEALTSVGADAVCVQSSRYCYLGETKPLNAIPTPKLLKIIKEFDPDFILTDFPYYISRLSKLVGRRLLFHMLGDLWTEFYIEGAMFPSFFVRKYIRYLTAITGPTIKEIDLILPVSKWLEGQIAEHLQNCPTEVLYIGINPGKWHPKSNAGGIFTLNIKHPAAVGLFPFHIYAKVLGLLKFTQAVKKMKDVNFYFAGDGPYMNLVRQECPSNMFLVGRMSGSYVQQFLDSGDVFVHPSGLDALPRSVKEAALMEKPIVASNKGGIPEIVKDGQTGYLCDINDTDQWTSKIRFLLDNPDIGRTLGKSAREFVARTFDWRTIAERFVRNLKSFKE